MGERALEGQESVDETKEKIQVIKRNLKVAQDRQKSTIDMHSKDRDNDVGVFAFLKLSPWKCSVGCGKQGKLSS